MERLAELGAYGLTFHDDDLFPFGSSDAERRRAIDRLTAALEADGYGRADGDNQPVHPAGVQGRRLHQQRPRRAPLRAAQGAAQHRSGRRTGRRDVRAVGRPRRQRVRRAPRTCKRRWNATARRSTCCASTCIDQGYRLRFAIEPKPNEPRGDILLPTVGHALAFIDTLDASGDGRASTRRSATSRWPGLNFMHGISQALYSGKLFHIDLNGQRGIKFDQDLVFGHGDLTNAFALVDCWRTAAPTAAQLRRAPALRLQAQPHRRRDRRMGLRRGQHADVPAAASSAQRRSAPTRRCSRRWPRPRWPNCDNPTLERRARPTRICWPTRSAYEEFDTDAYFGGKGLRLRGTQPAGDRTPDGREVSALRRRNRQSR